MERIGARYKHCTLDSFDAADNPLALEAARALADGSLEMLLLFGGAGRGKTHLLIAAGRDYERPASPGMPASRTSVDIDTGLMVSPPALPRSGLCWSWSVPCGDARAGGAMIPSRPAAGRASSS